VTVGAAELCLEELSNQLASNRIPGYVAAHADHVHVVVLDFLMRRKALVKAQYS
jgi:hypothetical protein